MKKDNLKNFMQAHKQQIQDDGFTKKIMEQLPAYPRIRETGRKEICINLIVPLFSLLSVAWIIIFGGCRALAEAITFIVSFLPNPVILALYVLITLAITALFILPVRLKERISNFD
jgi:Na+/alanine symporter